jgi:hypothetical protein
LEYGENSTDMATAGGGLKTLSISRTLARRSSAFGKARSISGDSFIMGNGSTPVSAIRPAKIETTAGTL